MSMYYVISTISTIYGLISADSKVTPSLCRQVSTFSNASWCEESSGASSHTWDMQ